MAALSNDPPLVAGKITYLPSKPAILAKRVNGGPWIHFGSYATHQLAVNAAYCNRAFHAERCPKDHVEYSVDGEMEA